MVTMEEIKEYVNDYIVTNEKEAMCFIRGTNIVIRLASGQYFKNNLDHLINQFTEIYDFVIEPKIAFTEIIYFYAS